MAGISFVCPSQGFRTSLSGVTHSNSDGLNRQQLLRKLRKGQVVKLVREPKNPHDKHAIAVLNSKNQIIGYIPAGDRRLSEHIDRGGAIESKIFNVTGGPNLLEKLFGRTGKNYGCVIEITKGDFNWKAVDPWISANQKICEMLKTAKKFEESNSKKAIATYRIAIDNIAELDSNGMQASAWRSAAYPINRLSLLLDKEGLYVDAVYEINRWKKYPDRIGISESDCKAVESRLSRLKRKAPTDR